jgi:hypothetical protein
VAAVAQQDVTLTNLRGRATGLLAAVTIGTPFAGGLGLFSVDPTKGRRATPMPGPGKGVARLCRGLTPMSRTSARATCYVCNGVYGEHRS